MNALLQAHALSLGALDALAAGEVHQVQLGVRGGVAAAQREVQRQHRVRARGGRIHVGGGGGARRAAARQRGGHVRGRHARRRAGICRRRAAARQLAQRERRRAGVAQQVAHVLLEDLDERHVQRYVVWRRRAGSRRIKLGEEQRHGARDDAAGAATGGARSSGAHGVRLAAAGLAVREHGGVEAVEEPADKRAHTGVEERAAGVVTARVVGKHVVEGEAVAGGERHLRRREARGARKSAQRVREVGAKRLRSA